MFYLVTLGVCLLVFTGGMIKSMALSDGGPAVAKMLGGRLIQGNATDLKLRRLLNVVEEMAIAAGMPVPRVYLLDDLSINAFAAGRSPTDAIIGITSGSLDQLDREELQAVIAHEFSHILNGDMLLNLRLTCLVHGIVLLGISGFQMVHEENDQHGEKTGSRALTFLLGLFFIVAGYAGTVLGQRIKAAIGRQREYLADASAIQFTRNKDGIVRALKKIGGSTAGSIIESSAASEYSHAYFADGISSVWQSLHATHPPLEKRIRKIEPYWNGVYIKTGANQHASSDIPEASQASGSWSGTETAIAAAVLCSAEMAISQIGSITEENITYARQLIHQIPEALTSAAQDSNKARAVVYVILIREQKDKTLAWSSLFRHADRNMAELAMTLFDAGYKMDPRFKLPLLNICINALKNLSTNQYIEFERSINRIIKLDKKIGLNEWVIQRLVLQRLDEHFGFRAPAKARYSSLNAIKSSAETVLSLIAYVEHKNDSSAKHAFNQAVKNTNAQVLNFIPRTQFSLDRLNGSVDDIMQLKPLIKPHLLKVCIEIILADGKATVREVELVRTISSCLDCPMPPMRA